MELLVIVSIIGLVVMYKMTSGRGHLKNIFTFERIGVFILSLWVYFNYSNGSLLTYDFFVIFVPVVSILFLFSRRGHLKLQKEHNEKAKHIATRLANGEEVLDEFVLHLRPFFFDNQVELTVSGVFSPLGSVGDNVALLEEAINYSVEKEGLIHLCATDGFVVHGSGAVDTSELSLNWRALLQCMIDKSEIITLIPSYTKATLWEIETVVLSDNLFKTIFIMPPKRTKMRSDSTLDGHWEKSREALNAFGVNLPLYNNCGLLFRFVEDEVEEISRLEWLNTKKFNKNISRVIVEMVQKNKNNKYWDKLERKHVEKSMAGLESRRYRATVARTSTGTGHRCN